MSSFLNISKSFTAYGLVQIVAMFAAIGQSKIFAVYLGLGGFGEFNILLTTLLVIQTFGAFGLPYALTREISLISDNRGLIQEKISISFTFVFLINVFIVLLIFVIDYLWVDLLLQNLKVVSISIVFTNINLMFLAVFQGERMPLNYGISSLFGSISSVFLSFVIFRQIGFGGIPWYLISAPFFTFIFNLIVWRKYLVDFKFQFSLHRTFRNLFIMGFSKMITTILGNVSTFFILSYIAWFSIEDVGLYQGGMKIAYQYVSVVFIAISMDFFPKLSSLIESKDLAFKYVNTQIKFNVMVITPLIVLLILISQILIELFLTIEFLEAVKFVRIISLGMFFMGVGQSLYIIPYAFGDRRKFLRFSLFGSVSLVLLSILGYRSFGLLGIASFFLLHSIIMFLWVYTDLRRYYSFEFVSSLWREILLGLSLVIVSLVISLHNGVHVAFKFLLVTFVAYYYLKKFIVNVKTDTA